VGRDAPLFESAWSSHARALEDPCIARQLFSIAWQPDQRRFSLLADEEASQGLQLLDPAGAPLPFTEAPAPGTLLALTDRVLVALQETRPVDRPQGLVGESEAISDLIASIARVGASDEAALLLGEPETGRELVAQAIHKASGRRAGPFRVLDGYTDEASLPSLLEQTTGGTLFIAELTHLYGEMQAALLRALEASPGAFRPMASAAEPLDALVARGALLPALAARLGGASIAIPPLRTRRGDIPLLMVQCLRRRLQLDEYATGTRSWLLARLWCRPDRHPAPLPLGFALDALRHGWPGNLRQLDEHVARLVSLNPTPRRQLVLPALPD
jgi:DNA-binding NtrC family response regulator